MAKGNYQRKGKKNGLELVRNLSVENTVGSRGWLSVSSHAQRGEAGGEQRVGFGAKMSRMNSKPAGKQKGKKIRRAKNKKKKTLLVKGGGFLNIQTLRSPNRKSQRRIGH